MSRPFDADASRPADRSGGHAEPPRLHGPYAQWSHQLEGRTAHVNLSSDQLEDYQAWFDGATRLRRLVGELEALSLTVVERDPRFERR